MRKADGWYAHIACDVAPSPLPPTGRSVGIDVGRESFATLSNGAQIANPRFYRIAERKLKTSATATRSSREGQQSLLQGTRRCLRKLT
ncbi:hypothetical protein [Chloroflexus sp.]|uniref:hypothetical protein n=1 Tax=Chloroflexus sp. TaxID=1904827 RepID=UPI002590C77D|nr:hypothetical protein [Chloroflexus sp.]